MRLCKVSCEFQLVLTHPTSCSALIPNFSLCGPATIPSLPPDVDATAFHGIPHQFSSMVTHSSWTLTAYQTFLQVVSFPLQYCLGRLVRTFPWSSNCPCDPDFLDFSLNYVVSSLCHKFLLYNIYKSSVSLIKYKYRHFLFFFIYHLQLATIRLFYSWFQRLQPLIINHYGYIQRACYW